MKNNKNKKNKKNKKGRRKTAVILVAVIAIIVLLGTSPLCNIRDIEVSRVNHNNSDNIIKVSGVVKEVNGFKNIGGSLEKIFSLRYGQAENNIISKCPYVKDVTVKYRIPGKILIHVEEREPYIIVSYIGTYLVLDRYGYVLEVIEEGEEHHLPFIKGLKFANYELGQSLSIENVKSYENLLVLIDALTEEEKNDNFNLIDNIDLLDISDINNIHIFIDSRLVVNIGDTQEISYKIKALKQIFYKNINKDEKGMLDFAAGEYPVFMPAE